MKVCIHFDQVRFKTRCELGNGRTAGRDCPCNAYEDDPGYKDRTLEADTVRDAAWEALRVQSRATGV